jgi:hypothetical protein
MYFDAKYFMCVVIPTMLLSTAAQFYLSAMFKKWSAVRNGNGLTGPQVGQQLINRTALSNIRLERIPGELTDHYDPSSHTVRMSDPVATQASVVSMAVVAHELGHAEQHQTRSVLIGMRSFLLPALRFSPTLSYGLIFAGIMFNITGLIWLGIFFFGLVVLFSVLTLPVEIDASRRGLRLLNEAGLLQTPQDTQGAREVLIAAAMTYLAAAVTSVLQLLYYVSLANRDDD